MRLKEGCIIGDLTFVYLKSKISQEQENLLEDLNTDYLYVKYFDVVWDEWDLQTKPTAVVHLSSKTDIPIIPTVFITTQALEHCDSSRIDRLARNVAKKIEAIKGDRQIVEIQFDCDWTPSLKDRYFYFLEKIREEFPGSMLSATIRLYQYKYPDIAGVPPVDKGMLMYYNMGDFTDYRESNSILNNDIGKEYLGFGGYPLPLDFALPNFEWGLSFRQGYFQYITKEISQEDLEDNSLFYKENENLYSFKKDTVIGDIYYRFGDHLRFESCSKEVLLTAAKLLRKEINQQKTRVIFYDLQPNTTKDYEKLDAVYSAFE
jgi:hypothetical protein